MHLVNVLGLSAVCAWAYTALSSVFPERRRLPIWREVLATLGGAFFVILAIIASLVFSFKQSPAIQALVAAVTAFILINVVIGMRWRRWSRGFMFGQVVSLLAAAAWLASTRLNAAQFPVWRAVADGFTSGMMSCVYWASAFTFAEKLGNSAAAITAGLMITIFLNATDRLTVIPLGVVWIAYAVIRSRSKRGEAL